MSFSVIKSDVWHTKTWDMFGVVLNYTCVCVGQKSASVALHVLFLHTISPLNLELSVSSALGGHGALGISLFEPILPALCLLMCTTAPGFYSGFWGSKLLVSCLFKLPPHF